MNDAMQLVNVFSSLPEISTSLHVLSAGTELRDKISSSLSLRTLLHGLFYTSVTEGNGAEGSL